ncbi:hypothetical protein [Agarivorans albus]|uniref:Uncharacterized protein n=1 Tax=Agarivorans albus MKT 106 TaxID=1331007 RepID=R9PJW6_AGAAL|nr:hypothetical protein [Agarivorans albus]GAD01640.1 hypothetical protein AALB_1720 [Agarivorans albus MKT 106]
MKKLFLALVLWPTFIGFVLAKPNLGGFKPEQVCQAAIASLQGVDVKMVDNYRSAQSLMQMRVRHNGQNHSYYCQLEGDQVLWRRAQDSRWQTSTTVRFHYNSSAKQLFIKHYLAAAQLAEYRYRGEDF